MQQYSAQIQPFAAVGIVKLFSSTWVSKKYISKAENISIRNERTCVRHFARMPLRLEIMIISCATISTNHEIAEKLK